MSDEKSIACVSVVERRAFNAIDMVGMRRVGAPVVAPDAKHVVFTVKQIDLDAKKSTTSIWLANNDDLESSRRLTHAEFKSDIEPIWYVRMLTAKLPPFLTLGVIFRNAQVEQFDCGLH